MKTKYILFLGLAAAIASCTKDFEEFNTDIKNPSTVSGQSLFSNAEITLSDQVSSTNVNLNVFKLFAQYWTETTYTDEANYDIINRGVPDLTFRQYYRGFLRDFQEADSLIMKTSPQNDAQRVEQTNMHAIIEMLVCYSYQNLVDIFGNVPYTEAMNINKISPKYDDAATIYQDLIRRVDAAVTSIDTTQGSFGTADLIYGGNTGKWRKFGNSLKVRLGITLSDVNPALAKSTVESAVASGVFTSNSDNALFRYLTAIHTNPIYQDVIQSGRNDFVPANTIVDLMNARQDPRRPFYFTMNNGVYVGGAYGESSPYSQYSHIADRISNPDFPGILLTYDEILFYLSEAASRGFNVGGTAASYYNAAITNSILFWGGTAADAATYLARPDVAFTGPGTWQQKIGIQSYIAFYGRGLEGFNQWRRLDYPVLNIPPAIQNYSDIPKRYTYPVNEQTLNKTNYESASQAIGGDLLTTRVFWDVRDPVAP
ncbi:MAG TPA: SusD/RagB family nutrient-binding outer membrane lipoprotein [Bacteroidales bacterium]|nr:SusD/RagB family nutrient-binding outer membrane lipoprotein [Bacteroidales bacterium]